MNKIKFDHFKNIDELLEHIDIWYKEDDIYYTRWFGLYDLKQLKDYIVDMQQENKQLKENYQFELEENSKLSELWCESQQENKQLKEDIIWWTNRFNAVERDNRNLKNEIQLRIKSIEKLENDIIKYQRKIQELKEKYK